MGQVLHRVYLQGQESVGVKTHVNNELMEVGGFSEGDRVEFREEVLG